VLSLEFVEPRKLGNDSSTISIPAAKIIISLGRPIVFRDIFFGELFAEEPVFLSEENALLSEESASLFEESASLFILISIPPPSGGTNSNESIHNP